MNINIFSIYGIIILAVYGFIVREFYYQCFKDFSKDITSLESAFKTSKENRNCLIFILASLLFTIIYFTGGEIKVGNEYEVLFKFVIYLLFYVIVLLGDINVNSKKAEKLDTLSNREKTLGNQIKEKKYIKKRKKKERQRSKAILDKDELNKSIKAQPYFLSQMIFLIAMTYLTWGLNIKELTIMAILSLITRNLKKIKKIIYILINGYLILTLFITENPFFILGLSMFILGLVVLYIHKGKAKTLEYKIPIWQLYAISLLVLILSILASIKTEILYIGFREGEDFTPCYIIIELAKDFLCLFI